MKPEAIRIRGARQHNLKNVDLDLPHNRLIVVTGLSGSGKSTLAFDTLYAEGQRRYVESLSTYARQFLERLDKPDVDAVDGLSPAIAIEQKNAGHNPRSTVGTVTEIHDYLRLLFARTGTPHCHVCGRPITAQSVDAMADAVLALGEGRRILILSPLVTDRAGDHAKLLKRLRKEGFARVRVDGRVLALESAGRLDPDLPHTIDVVVDRLVVKAGIRNRLADSLELALAQSEGLVKVLCHGEDPPAEPMVFSERAACTACGISYPEFTPASFSFNSPQGACPGCDGLGSTTAFDPDLIVPNPGLSLREGAVAPWADRDSVHFAAFLEALTGHYGADIHTPYERLPDRFKTVLMEGSGDEEITHPVERNGRRTTWRGPFEGVIPGLARRRREAETPGEREEVARYLAFTPCPRCRGARLNRASRSVTVGGETIDRISARSIQSARSFFEGLSSTLTGRAAAVAGPVLKEILDRIGFLSDVGLGYLTLDRQAQTLSGGESQRIRLATQIGSKLTGVLYVLDEPSIGLHHRDNARLLETLFRMRDLGNTVLVVEHDEETIRSADHVVDMGPGAGMEGGEVVFSGTPAEMSADPASLTGRYLSGRMEIEVPGRRRKGSGKFITIQGAAENNLKGIDVAFPLGCLICVTGVSGSGKSSLVIETLYRALFRRIYRSRTPAGAHRTILGLSHIDKVVNIDQSPIGRTPRSNPGTYTGVFTPVRDLFARTREARARGYRPGRFSFNVKGGRCEACGGDGVIRIEMHFLPDVYVTCDVCRGRRYNRETLEIRYKGATIAEVLDMTVARGLSFFERIGAIRTKLSTLVDVGLGYVRLGQPATTLSGGEAQRMKLARELSKKGTGGTVYILDEPTTGLHMDDIRRLLEVLNRLVDLGNTVVVIEHNMDVIKSADHLIDLGPEGGEEGGGIVAEGPPEAVARVDASHTGRYLQKYLG